ncbi:MAG: anti-sigma factor [Terriglobales bacterium]
MNVHEQFVDDLTLYALDSLDGAERIALEKHLEDCPSCRRELEQLRGDLGLLAMTTAGPKPPARSRQRLIAAIAKEPRMPAVVMTRPQRPRRPWWGYAGWAAAAALLLLAVSLERQNSGLERNQQSLRTQLVGEQTSLLQANEILSTLLDPGATKVELVAAGVKLQPHGKAIYQPRNRSLIFFASDLAPLPAEKIYELWLFPANGGAPIAAGLFKPDEHGSAMVVNPPLPEGVEAKNFAVTLEPESGSHEAPRGTPVIVGVGE